MLREQLHFYFSPQNLSRDRFLLAQIAISTERCVLHSALRAALEYIVQRAVLTEAHLPEYHHHDTLHHNCLHPTTLSVPPRAFAPPHAATLALSWRPAVILLGDSPPSSGTSH